CRQHSRRMISECDVHVFFSVANKYCVSAFFLFFFSSRRRHTRWPRDWSSDVCSSDLHLGPHQARALLGGLGARRDRDSSGPKERSEERRVGKECRSRWWPYN